MLAPRHHNIAIYMHHRNIMYNHIHIPHKTSCHMYFQCTMTPHIPTTRGVSFNFTQSASKGSQEPMNIPTFFLFSFFPLLNSQSSEMTLNPECVSMYNLYICDSTVARILTRFRVVGDFNLCPTRFYGNTFLFCCKLCHLSITQHPHSP